MVLIKALAFILKSKKDFFYFQIIILGIILTTILETFSIAIIIPVFEINFLEKIPENNFIKLDTFQFNSTLKILAVCGFFFIFFIKSIFIICFNLFFINYLTRLNTNISSRLFSLFLKQDYIFFVRGKSKYFLNQITDDVHKLQSFLLSLINLLTEIIFVFVISIFLILINYKIFLFCFSLFFFSIFIYFYIFKKKIDNWSSTNIESSVKIKNLVIDGINGIKDIIIYKMSNSFCNLFNSSSSSLNTSRSRIDFLSNVQKNWLELVAIFAMCLASIYFVIHDLNVNTYITVFGVFIFALLRLLNSFNRIVVAAQTLRYTYVPFISIVKQLQNFESFRKIYENNNIQFEESIEFKNVNFFYDSESSLTLNSINIKIKKNECIGILGDNGSGKSTLLYLLSGLINPTEGIILVDDKHDLFKNRLEWNEKLSYVQQNIFLINSTIKHNICLQEDHQIDNSKLDKVIDDLQLNSFFKALPNKLNTVVGINGLNLSGGQKQMISLGRALYKNNEILILDEPSSALDYINTDLVKKVIQSLKNKKTILIVTHESNAFNDCFDRVINLKAGKII
jgi:ABC-type multidrug transport system fused ATPase/permease subunit